MERGDLLICNHALFFSDLALRQSSVGFLPDYQHVILDEAHCVEDVATEHFGASLSEGRVNHLLSLLSNEKSGRGFLAQLKVTDSQEMVDRASGLVSRSRMGGRVLFDRLAQFAGADRGEVSVRAPGAGEIEDTVSEPFAQLALSLKRLREIAADDEDRYELSSYAERCAAIASDAKALLEQSMAGCAYWIEAKRSARGSFPGASTRVTLACSPVEVGPILREALFEQDASVVLTSATMTVGTKGFDHLAERLGCEISDSSAQTLLLGSPFDLASQIEVFIDATMPDPRSAEYIDALADRVAEQVIETDGGAFVLFTSLATLRQVNTMLRPRLEAEGIHVFSQGIDGPRTEILAKFRASGRGALLGAASFWQGVDVRGDALRNVIITRLPFEPPGRPLTEARAEMIRERGGNPFMVDSLPRAALRFKQGIGRLVRSSKDRGRIVVLDPRIVTARYGKTFQDALPEGARVHQRGPDGWL